MKIADNKALTYKLLERGDFPIAKSLYVRKENFEKILENIILPFPVIIKPLDGAHGNGVHMNIVSNEELYTKLDSSFAEYGNMIIQRQISGDEFRVMVFDDTILIAYKRVPPAVIGDGKHTILELVQIENETNPLRKEGYQAILSHIIIDEEFDDFIAKQ